MNFKKQQTKFFILIIFVFSICVFLTVFLLLINIDIEIKLSLIFIELLISLLFLFNFKTKFDFYSIKTKYQSLLDNKNAPYKLDRDTANIIWKSVALKNNYVLFKNFTNFNIYYKFEYVNGKTKRFKTAIIIVNIKDDSSFESPSIIEVIDQFDEQHYKTEKYNNHIVLQFKKTNEITPEKIKDADKIIFSKQQRNHYVVLLNVYYSPINSYIYYLHSDTFSPNHFFTYATKEIKSLMNS